jgi:predicted amidohydrolase YtcJ
MFPDKPVFLRRIDGHAGVANSKALALANITLQTKVSGGEIVIKNKELTGLLIDNAMTLVENKIPQPNNFQIQNGDFLLENINYREIKEANAHALRFMQSHPVADTNVSALEIEALALEYELQLKRL